MVAFIEPDTASGGSPPGAGMVLASGLFDEVKIESLMREHGATVETYKDKRLIVALPNGRPARRTGRERRAGGREPPPAHPELALAFLKPGLVAVGSANLIRQAVDREQGGENITDNTEVMNLIRSIDSGNAWAVGRFDAIQSAAKLPPVLSQLPAITWFSVTGQINDTISGAVRAETRDEDVGEEPPRRREWLPGARQAAGGIETGVPGAGSIAAARRHRQNGGAVVRQCLAPSSTSSRTPAIRRAGREPAH